MESKHIFCNRTPHAYDASTFNRTSMESKQYPKGDLCLPPHLLIEPVWNRNFNIYGETEYIKANDF